MRKRMTTLLASTMMVAGLAAGVTPAHAAPTPDDYAGLAYRRPNFGEAGLVLRSEQNCRAIDLLINGVAFSAKNDGKSSIVTLYHRSFLGYCVDQVAVLSPGEIDSGFTPGTNTLNELGSKGAYYYSST